MGEKICKVSRDSFGEDFLEDRQGRVWDVAGKHYAQAGKHYAQDSRQDFRREWKWTVIVDHGESKGAKLGKYLEQEFDIHRMA